MHQPIQDRLEDYLRNGKLPEVDAHLGGCGECREEMAAFERQAELIRTLRAPEDVAPRGGFYARVMDRIEQQRRSSSIWSVFLEPAFGKRLVYASATLLVLLGTYLYSTEPMAPPDARPEVILAEQDQASEIGRDTERDREAILVNLATYED
jgi:hypothetical protein